MIVLICFLLLAFGLVCLWRRRTRAAVWTVALAALLLFGAGSGALGTLLLPSADATKTTGHIRWQEHNSIVLLGAGTRAPVGSAGATVPFFGYSRIAAAATAYFSCIRHGPDCKVIVSGGDPQRHGATEAAVYAAALKALNVPQSDIILEPRSKNTWQNAQESTAIIPAGRLVVVATSGFQLERALLYFSHFRAGVVGYPSDYFDIEFTLMPSSQNIMITDALLHEQIGILRYHVYNALGWNAPKK
ncbi:YdcF family protein [soil metagenome]